MNEKPMSDKKMSEEKKMVEGFESPINLRYNFAAGRATSSFLRGIQQGKILGHRSSVTGKVTVPPRGADPETGTPTTEEVLLPETATVCSFTIVHIPIPNAAVQPPFVVANMVFDNADQTFIHLISEIPNDQVRIGMKVKAVWRDSSEWALTMDNIKYFVPTGEPDIDVQELKSQRLKETATFNKSEKSRNA